MKIFKIISFLVFVLLVSNTTILMRDYIRTPRNIRNFLFQEGDILEGMSTGPSEISLNYNKQISTGSPLIFGGAHSPNLDHQEAWSKLEEVGVTVMRKDFYIEWELPPNITQENYKNNVNDIQNPDKWNNSAIEKTTNNYLTAKKHGMKVIGILAYAPAWLSSNGKQKSIPSDWDIYEDIVKKLYRIHRNYIDYLEIWNEPDHNTFMDLTNISITKQEAYKQIYFHASKAIREVESEIKDEKKILIGGPAISNFKDLSFIEALLNDPQLKNQVDFISFHYYGYEPYNFNNLRQILKKYRKENIPIFVTEWNHSGNRKEPDTYIKTNLAIPFTGDKLLQFLREGIKGANYFATVPVNEKDPSYNYYGFYNWVNGKADLLPQAKTWRLLSKSMALGKGVSKIYESVGSTPSTLLPFLTDELSSVGFENINNHKGVAMVNDQDQDKYVAVTLNGVNPGKFGRVKIDMYVASADYDGGQVISSEIYPAKNSQVKLQLLLPSQSVIGLLLSPDTPLQDIIRTLIP